MWTEDDPWGHPIVTCFHELFFPLNLTLLNHSLEKERISCSEDGDNPYPSSFPIINAGCSESRALLESFETLSSQLMLFHSYECFCKQSFCCRDVGCSFLSFVCRATIRTLNLLLAALLLDDNYYVLVYHFAYKLVSILLFSTFWANYSDLYSYCKVCK